MNGRRFMPAKKSTKKVTEKATKKTGKKTTKTESVPKKGKKVKQGQAYECGICGFRLVIDDCGCIEEHYLICCKETMTQKKSTATAKKAAPKTAKKTAAKTTKKAAPKTVKKVKLKK
jgi:hypothetical protein